MSETSVEYVVAGEDVGDVERLTVLVCTDKPCPYCAARGSVQYGSRKPTVCRWCGGRGSIPDEIVVTDEWRAMRNVLRALAACQAVPVCGDDGRVDVRMPRALWARIQAAMGN